MDTTNSSENPQRRVKHGQRPTEPLAGWPAEFGAGCAAELARPAATSGDAPTDVQVAAARAVLEQKWDAEGACESCGWHAALGEYHVDADDISDALQHGGKLILQCISKDDETRDSHRGVSIDLIARIESIEAPADAPAAFAKRYSELLCENRKLKAQVESAAHPATASGDELPTPWEARLRLYPTNDYRWACIEAEVNEWRARAAVSAATKPPSERDMAIAQAVRQACCNCYSPDDSADDWGDKMGDIDLSRIIARFPLAATKPTADSELEFNATRLRNVAKLVGLEKSIPEDDATLDGARGSVLGLIAGALRNAATKPAAAPEGFVIVPKVPTAEMLTAGRNAWACNAGMAMEFIYPAMIAAAPAASTPAAPAEPVELMGVREEIEAGSGFWHTCSGCHETEDGHPVGRYHYSEAMRCALGTGCSECGGIGAVWDNNDYEAMARDWDKPDAASTTGAAQTAEQVREQALEEAARHCESDELLFDVAELMQRTKKDLTAITANMLAEGIRALKRPTPTHSSEAGDA